MIAQCIQQIQIARAFAAFPCPRATGSNEKSRTGNSPKLSASCIAIAPPRGLPTGNGGLTWAITNLTDKVIEWADCRYCDAGELADDYIDDLWFLLHHSDDEDDRVVLGLTLYLDDSGSDDGSTLVTIGGPAMSRIQFRQFSSRWNALLADYRIDPPLKFTDFYGDGRYSGWYPEMKRALFIDVSRLVNQHKLYSVSLSVMQADFNACFLPDLRKKLIGPYAFAFYMTVLVHQAASEQLQSGHLRAAYLVDTGFGHSDQLIEAHKGIVEHEKRTGEFRHTGALGFDADDDVPALQAADVIAGAARRRQMCDGLLPKGFEPLEEVLRYKNITPHLHIPLPLSGMTRLAEMIHRWISADGSMPSLSDIIMP